MKSSIKTCLAESKRITGSAKLTICTAVILSLAFTANLSAVPTTFRLDGSEAWSGTWPGDMTLAAPYGLGGITFSGEIWQNTSSPDIDILAAGSNGECFDILGPGDVAGGDRTAELKFDFDVSSLSFVYGGNYGTIMIEARDIYGNVVDFLATQDTGGGMTAVGPDTSKTALTLSGPGIRSLYWIDDFITPDSGGAKEQDYAVLDNIDVTVGVIPSPTAFVLAGIGVSFVGWLRKRKIV